MMHECELCSEIASRPSRFSRIYKDVLPDRIIAATPNFLLFPSIGQLGDAHLLVVSRAHYTAVTQLPAAQRHEISFLVGRARSWLKETAGQNILIFENGDPDGQGRMGCTISHMHLHIVASTKTFLPIRSVVESLGADCVQSLDALQYVTTAYSYIEFSESDALLITRRLPSQTLRRLLALEFGRHDRDWRAKGRERELVELVLAGKAELLLRPYDFAAA
jgi:diadenosine tetraphosphate (Ap4A) HIT family hydrolase